MDLFEVWIGVWENELTWNFIINFTSEDVMEKSEMNQRNSDF